MSTGEDPRIGTELGGFRIDSLIGRGGMGVVYLAEQLRYGRKAALKVLAPELTNNPNFRERFEQEWRTAARLDHPHIVPIYEAGEADGVLYIAMRYVEGIDLGALIYEQGRLSTERTLAILGDVAGALDAAHRQGLVHRDVKPANILVASGSGLEGDHAYLADFGVAKLSQTRSGLTQTGVFIGTVDYAAPEQIEGKPVDGRADVYALGCVAYHSLTGVRPFEKDSEVALLSAHLFEPPPSLSDKRPDLPAALDDVIKKALAKSPNDRHETCLAFVADARRAAGFTKPATPATVSAGPTPTRLDVPLTTPAPPAGTVPVAPVPPPPPGGGGAEAPWWRRRLVLLGTVGIVAILGIGLGVGLGMGGGGDDPGAQPTPPVEPEPPAPQPEPPAPPPEPEPPAPPDPPASEAGTLVFASERDGDFDIYAMALDGTGRVRLTNHPATDGGPRFSPDGSRIAFYSDRDGDYELYLMNPDGSDVVKLTDDTVSVGRPTFSPDGARLAFVAGSGVDAELWTMNVDGTDLVQLTTNGQTEGSPSWSPDGATIAVSRYDGNDYEIWLVNADGTGEIQLTDNTADDDAPSFSPDGSSLAFSSNRQNGNYDIWVMAADGSTPRRLATASREDGIPTFVPDGTAIAFDSSRDGDFEIFLMSANGSGQTQLTDDLTPDFEPDVSTRAPLPTGEPLPFLESSSAFPTRAEALLLSHVPRQTRKVCEREQRDDIAGRAIAGLVCRRGPVTAFYDLFRTKATMRAYYERAAANVNAPRGSGSCQSSSISEGYWTLGERRVGRLLCYTSSSGGRVIIWSFEDLRIVAWAQRSDDNRDALYRFWRGPHAGPVE